MLPGNLQEKIALLDNNPGVGLVCSNIVTINDQGKQIGCYYIKQPENDAIFPGCDLYK